MMLLLVFARILMLESFNDDVGGSDKSEEGGIILMLFMLLLNVLYGAMDAFRWTSV